MSRRKPEPIRVDEWIAELDSLRTRPREHHLSPEVIRLLVTARTPDINGRIVPYDEISKLIKKHFGIIISATTLTTIYNRDLRDKP